MLMGITHPDQGSVAFEGGPTLNRSRIGYLPEERGLYEEATCFDTLVYLARLRRLDKATAHEQARHWLHRVGLGDQMKAKVNSLSKGNQQKVQFAAAVLHDPALAVLDEPFSGLDPLNQELFLDLIRELREQGAAVLLSAHQLDLVERLCDRFMLISQGRELLHGTLQDVRRDVAGGAEEVLAVGLRSSANGSIETEIGQAIKAASPGLDWRIESTTEGALNLEVSMPHGLDLSPILSELGDRFRIEHVEMRPLSLHEIYVRAVREDRGERVKESPDA
jgi:ABC-2 type transport system ATP-binding protein